VSLVEQELLTLPEFIPVFVFLNPLFSVKVICRLLFFFLFSIFDWPLFFVLLLRMAPLLSSDLSYNVFTNQNVAYKSYFFM